MALWLFFDALVKVTKSTIEKIKYKNVTLKGLALSTVMHSFAPLDENHAPLTNFITWADSRSAAVVKEM